VGHQIARVADLAVESPQPSNRRVFLERRGGVDRRGVPRRFTYRSVSFDVRQMPDRRRCAERRSTLERRMVGRRSAIETASEHLRNALQLLAEVAGTATADVEAQQNLEATVKRLRQALSLLDAGQS
jgi:hypothetical protein